MPWRLLGKAQVLTKRISLNPILDFSQIIQTSLRGVGDGSQRLYDEYFQWWNQQLPKGEGEKLLYYSLKTSHWKLASRNRKIRFWNRNIQFLKYSSYKANRTVRFGKQNIRFFPGFCERWSVWGHCVSLISLGVFGYVSIETLLAIHVVSLLIEQLPILKVKYKNNIFILRLHILIGTSSLFYFMRVGTFDLVLTLTL
jgi:hypothetical protein